mmetsp:Transcript_118700/g.177431  ORF Transcript_118700/g.177431 Transcript_118700/m.177431 type:complete len:136 (-) Transcript_118700:24-431(-)
MNVSVPGVCVSVLGGMTFLLGLNVSLHRRKAKIGGAIKTDSTSPVYIASRAHGNTVEYVPTVIGIIIWIVLHKPYPVWMDVLMGLFTFSRILFVYGLFSAANMDKPNKSRFFGATGTYFFGAALAGCAAFVTLRG